MHTDLFTSSSKKCDDSKHSKKNSNTVLFTLYQLIENTMPLKRKQNVFDVNQAFFVNYTLSDFSFNFWLTGLDRKVFDQKHILSFDIK